MQPPMRPWAVFAVVLIAAPVHAEEAALDATALESVTGGQSMQVEIITDQTLSGRSENNRVTADSIETGTIRFESGSLDGFSGIGNFVLNTGNNNVLQGSIAVTVVNAAP